jgi:16S rRNA (guanine527-N7)-methyltransferase
MENNAVAMLGHLRQVAYELKMEVTEEQYTLFGQYFDFLLEYNVKVNLTRITEPREAAVKHFGDSLAVLRLNLFLPGRAVVDVGTGAGFPGIPIAIMCPEIRFTLMDSLRKRTVFLAEAVQMLNLRNVQVVWARAEEMGHNPIYREHFDIALARAVAPLNVLVELCLPLLKQGGVFLAMKGPKAGEELSQARGAIAKLGGVVVSSVTESLPLLTEQRTVVTVGKIRRTPAIYPRKAGIPERQPLA